MLLMVGCFMVGLNGGDMEERIETNVRAVLGEFPRGIVTAEMVCRRLGGRVSPVLVRRIIREIALWDGKVADKGGVWIEVY